jgi:ABC-2 type transport system permease protein
MMNANGVGSIYYFEMARARRTLWQSLVAPVITTSLYFLVFGSAIGSRMTSMAGVEYGSFIVPGLILLSVLTQSIFNASFGIYFPKFTGTIYEVLSAPISPFEIVTAYVGAAATKAVILALVTLLTATLFVDVSIAHPIMMLLFLIAISIGFCLLGFAIGLWAQNFEQLQVIPLLVVTPLTFLGGVFYSVAALGEPWRTVTHLNPILYLVSGFRWTFFGTADVPLLASLAVMAAAILLPLATIVWIFRTGYRLKS